MVPEFYGCTPDVVVCTYMYRSQREDEQEFPRADLHFWLLLAEGHGVKICSGVLAGDT